MRRNQKTFRPKKNAPSGNKCGMQLSCMLITYQLLLRNCRFLQPGEHLVRHFDGVLHTKYMSNNVSRTQFKPLILNSYFRFEYRWADGVQIKKPIEVSAPKYVEYLMDWIEAQLDNKSIFPQKIGTQFPQNFKDVVKTIFKRLFRVYAHIYHSHFQKTVNLKEEAHLNTCFKHFTLFTWEFKLIDKAELAPLIDLTESIVSVC
nr:unnamed protein product [Digitaria exilis]